MTLFRTTSLTVATAALLGGGASAATLTLDSANQGGFTIAPFSTQNSANCPTPGDTCLLVDNGSSNPVLTYAGGAFDLTGLHFILNRGSNDNTLTLTAQFLDGTTAAYDFNLAAGFLLNTTYDLPLALANLTSLTFSHSGGGTARVDDIGVSPAAVPLPMTSLLLSTALAGVGLVGRRRRAT